jgi:hypothetical protein
VILADASHAVPAERSQAYDGLRSQPADFQLYSFSPFSFLSIMSSPLHTVASNELTGVDYSHDQSDDKRGVTSGLEMVDSGLDSDKVSDINPGGLTFEEGLSS